MLELCDSPGRGRTIAVVRWLIYKLTHCYRGRRNLQRLDKSRV
jgi:hypothetical protein